MTEEQKLRDVCRFITHDNEEYISIKDVIKWCNQRPFCQVRFRIRKQLGEE